VTRYDQRRIPGQRSSYFAGQKFTDRLVSLFDADVRPVRRGKLAKPTEFGYVVQLTEVTANTRQGQGLLPPSWRPLDPREHPAARHRGRTGRGGGDHDQGGRRRPGFLRARTQQVLAGAGNPEQFIAGDSDNAGSLRTRRRRARSLTA
jgi:hypothetical protein